MSYAPAILAPVTGAVIEHMLRMRGQDLPASAQRATIDLVLDSIGVGTAGSSTPESRRALDVVRTWGSGEEATVWSVGTGLPAISAAFVNAHQMHCLEFDAIHEPGVAHPMTVVFPVLAAWVQRAKQRGEPPTSGADFLKAVAVGVDIAGGLGQVSTAPIQFFRPGTNGALGSVAALTVLTNADSDVAAGAFGVVYGAISGTMQAHKEGAQVLALQVGFNARAALSGFDLARAGFRGPRQVLEGEFGFYRLIEASGTPESLATTLGIQWEVERTSIKPFPSGRATHGVLDGILDLRAQHGFTLADVAQIEIWVPSMVHGLVGRPPSRDLIPGTARLCLAFLVAVALRDGGVGISSYADQQLRDETLLETADRVIIHIDDNPDPNAFDPQTVVVRLRSGVDHRITLSESLGSPSRPMSVNQLEDKFRGNLAAGGRQDHADSLIAAARGLPDTDDVCTMLDLM